MNMLIKGIRLSPPANRNNSNRATVNPMMNPATVPLINGNNCQPSSAKVYRNPTTIPATVIQVNCLSLNFWFIVSFTFSIQYETKYTCIINNTSFWVSEFWSSKLRVSNSIVRKGPPFSSSFNIQNLYKNPWIIIRNPSLNETNPSNSNTNVVKGGLSVILEVIGISLGYGLSFNTIWIRLNSKPNLLHISWELDRFALSEVTFSARDTNY